MDPNLNKQYLPSLSLKVHDGIYNPVFNYILCPQLPMCHGKIIAFSSGLCLHWSVSARTILQGHTVFYPSTVLGPKYVGSSIF